MLRRQQYPPRQKRSGLLSFNPHLPRLELETAPLCSLYRHICQGRGNVGVGGPAVLPSLSSDAANDATTSIDSPVVRQEPHEGRYPRPLTDEYQGAVGGGGNVKLLGRLGLSLEEFIRVTQS